MKKFALMSMIAAPLIALAPASAVPGPSAFRLVGEDAVLKTYNYYVPEDSRFAGERTETCWNYFVFGNGAYDVLPNGEMICDGNLDRDPICAEAPRYDYNRGGIHCADGRRLRRYTRAEFVNSDAFLINQFGFTRCFTTESYHRPAYTSCTAPVAELSLLRDRHVENIERAA